MTAADWSAMEAGVAYVRTAAAFGHPPYTVTEGYPSPEQPLGYQLSKTAETVWAAVSSGQSGLVPYLVPVRNYMTALAAKVGIAQARDFAPRVLTERVRQEEDGWPDHPGDHRGLRTGHGTGAAHLCLLQRKHEVEDAIYGIEVLGGVPDGQLRQKSVAARTIHMTESHAALELVPIYRDRTNRLN